MKQKTTSVREVRIKKQLTQHELAVKARIDQAGLSRIESGIADPRFSTVMKLADALGVPLEELRPEPASRESLAAGGRDPGGDA